MSYSVYLCQPFQRSVKLLLKRFPHVKDDVTLALREILQGGRPIRPPCNVSQPGARHRALLGAEGGKIPVCSRTLSCLHAKMQRPG